ncbi:uncharacterized protein A1O9_08742 [Exophiala aquamarina CBS 119918]|uniref:Metallo-beta-lactamase domain-containing protein n=1 Tax=Exophiala aquamarina CBS 119918 TaxID=1182545 RepID=A0A072P4P6_9EURO|nr:uncharacterized protein A1O9_08742 [Exophiala aquamarina CBS 119918]KEF55089.1 hypothetical protein A1O9_08742 [Exophiala aquamarina CBS 119918]
MAATQSNGVPSGPRPRLNIPGSSVSISVKIIDASTISNVPAQALFTPLVPGFTTAAAAPSFCFLLEHPSGQKVLFDLGIRKDWQNLAPAIVERFKKVGHQPSAEKNVSEVLDEAGVGKENINAVIWSHAHWDHLGDMSTFGPQTDLVVGPGFKDFFLGEGNGKNSTLGSVQPSDVEGRTVREIDFQGTKTHTIGRFKALDYFQDGSLYLLDTPGHCVGHLCALVRTTTNPDTFVFLGGDAAHHCGEVRPSAYVPMPQSIATLNRATHADRQSASFTNSNMPVCPCSWFDELQVSRNRDPAGPLWQPAFGHNMEEVMTTIEGMQEYDGDGNVFVILAHDPSLRCPEVPFFPEQVNNWKERGLGQKLRWVWTEEILAAIKTSNDPVDFFPRDISTKIAT